MKQAARRIVTVLVAALAVSLSASAALDHIVVQASEPRAFGYSIGDVVSRHVVIDAPPGLALDAGSLPSIGRRGKALELRQVAWRQRGEHYEIDFEYQVFLAPREVRTLEMPTVMLRFLGSPRAQDVRIEAWPVTVAPLVPVEVSPRHGLGELQPDRPTPLIDTHAARQRMALYGAVILVLLAYLAGVYWGMPWWSSRHRPFSRAWAALRTMHAGAPSQAQAAVQHLHEALNLTAGQVLFEPGLDRFLAAQPRFEPVRFELARFFGYSRGLFFGNAADDGQDLRWLIDFCRRCRDLERGAA